MRKQGTALWLALVLLVVGCSSKPAPAGTTDIAPPNTARASVPLTMESLPAAHSGVTFLPGIAACSWGVGRLDVFAAASDGTLWQLTFAADAWGSWQAVTGAGVTDTGLSAISRGAHSFDLFYRDAASQRLGHSYFEKNAGWRSEQLGSATISALAPAATSAEADRIDVFTQGPGSTLLHIWQDSTWQSDWTTEAGVSNVDSAIAATAWGPDRLDVFWPLAGDRALAHWSSADDQKPQLEQLTGDASTSPPSAASRAAGLLDVVHLSGSSTLVRHYFDEGWKDEAFRLPESSSVASASWGPGRVDVFALGLDGNIAHALIPGPSVLTQHNDIARTGGNTHEVELNVDNVASEDFGQLFTIPVDGNVWAQPLYQSNVDLSAQGQGIRNVLYVATGNDSVYLFDADTGEPLAQASLGNPVPVPFSDFTTGSGSTTVGDTCNFNSLPQIGITSTPVLDPDTSTLYVVALSADEALTPEPIAQCAPSQTPQHVYSVQLHALDSRTLTERSGSPVTINPTYDYGGETIQFLPNRQLQRPSLLLSQGAIYLAFGSYTDRRPYYGWVVSYDATSLEQRDVWVDTPAGVSSTGGGMGGIWQSGQGLAADPDGNVYFFTGNGPSTPSYKYANAAVELSPTLSMVSYFRPSNAAALDKMDLDFSSSGAMLVPNTNFVVGGGKEGRMYVMNQGDMGGQSDSDDVAFEDLTAIPSDDCAAENGGISNLHSSTIYWKSASGPANLYLMGEADYLKKLELDETSGVFSVVAQSDERSPCGMPGGFLSVSSNGDNPKTGIVWANVPTSDASQLIVPANFYAYDAETMTTLYKDESRAIPSSTDKFAKYVAPTVANGRVYQAAFGPANATLGSLNDHYSGSVVVYGLKPK